MIKHTLKDIRHALENLRGQYLYLYPAVDPKDNQRVFRVKNRKDGLSVQVTSGKWITLREGDKLETH